ncbi:MAG: HD domain-containing protein [Calditrichaeota bacterium]|nr:MAG: HD domain-containing protein [Calditrichota bacterium]MBL1206286.1 HD domain-containing protein [Calditrichota bacterium]NOG46112.1 response regulator [Calditrichota bacterium]
MSNGLSHKVLLVEDEAVTHRAICKTFEKHKYNYVGVKCLSDAMVKVKTEHFDIIFSDIVLPDGSGLELLDAVHNYLLDVPFVVITASENEQLLQSALSKGASDFLSKPFNLQNIPTIISRNIERKRIEHDRQNPRNATALLKAIKALISALEAKDSYTSGHSMRVAHYAKLMGDELNLTDDQKYCLNLSAILHDIGKIGLSDHILKKNSSLLESEYHEAKEHPLIGSKIVGNIDELHEVAAIIRHHHERFDGNGYPDGLKGEAIPILARVLAIVDTYEAIVSRRYYGTEETPQRAFFELEKNAGTQFDPELVKIFVRLGKHPEFFNIKDEFI